MSKYFRGGVAFPEKVSRKDQTAEVAVTDFSPKKLIIPVNQGIASSGKPLVTVGDHVLAGQMIAAPADKNSVPVHCGESGTVTAVKEHDFGDGPQLCVEVECDGQHTPGALLDTSVPLHELMQNAGLIGLGGAGFPTFRKYAVPGGIQTVLINGCECEPYLTSDEHIMTHYPCKVIEGALAMAESVGAAPIICVETDKEACRRMLEDAAKGKKLTVISLPTRYPQGGERQLIQSVLGKELRSGQLPYEVGTLITNVSTAAAMGDALEGHALTHRLVTVSGLVGQPRVVRVPIGTPVGELIDFCGRSAAPPDTATVVVSGGPMTGRQIHDPGQPVVKTTSGVLVLQEMQLPEKACIHCGACVRVCPSGLMPYAIDACVESGRFEQLADFHAEQCIRCGCCSYVCPAKRYIAARVSCAIVLLKKQARKG